MRSAEIALAEVRAVCVPKVTEARKAGMVIANRCRWTHAPKQFFVIMASKYEYESKQSAKMQNKKKERH